MLPAAKALIRSALLRLALILLAWAAFPGCAALHPPPPPSLSQPSSSSPRSFPDAALREPGPGLETGVHRGGYEYLAAWVGVEVVVKDGRMESITVYQNRDTAHAAMAESVVPRVLAAQDVDVDAATGATSSSRAILQAIHQALTGEKAELTGHDIRSRRTYVRKDPATTSQNR
jgi:uncharacterized protein with FMN-binding domain